ncbi:MAG: tRNA pseudouridine(38-40) synthase TruA [Hyphomicrobiaceae bacterium]
MTRYRITVEYDGRPFVGWQVQGEAPTVQASLVRAIHRLSGEIVIVRGAGRTDSGVHALGQVAHFDLPRPRDPFRIREALNFHLRPDPVAVLDCTEAPTDFDARFSATARHYLYRILARRAPPALDIGRVWWLPMTLDVDAMVEGARNLVGRHDFTTFRAAACQADSAVRTLDRLEISRVGEEIHVNASARSFLHNQVRSMVGSLKQVATGQWRPREIADALAARDRARCGVVAPPDGLYLARVDYGAVPACVSETNGDVSDT